MACTLLLRKMFGDAIWSRKIHPSPLWLYSHWSYWSVVMNMLLVHAGAVVRDVVCTVSSTHCMHTIYWIYSQLRLMLKIRIDSQIGLTQGWARFRSDETSNNRTQSFSWTYLVLSAVTARGRECWRFYCLKRNRTYNSAKYDQNLTRVQKKKSLSCWSVLIL